LTEHAGRHHQVGDPQNRGEPVRAIHNLLAEHDHTRAVRNEDPGGFKEALAHEAGGGGERLP
jgi:hypothetical protein